MSEVDVEVVHLDGSALVAVRGEIDLGSAGEFRRALREAVSQAGGQVQVDLSGTDHMGSEGIGALVGVLKTAERRGLQFRIIACSPAVHRVLSAAGLPEMFGVAARRPDAG